MFKKLVILIVVTGVFATSLAHPVWAEKQQEERAALVSALAEAVLYKRLFSKYYAKTKELTPLEITLDDKGTDRFSGLVFLSIPKAYIEAKRQWNGGRYKMIVMSSYLPDMDPISLVENPDGKKGVIIRIDRGMGVGRGYLQRKIIKKERANSLERTGKRVNGLEEYKNYSPAFDYDYYTKKNKDDYLIECARYKNARCTVKTDYDESVMLEYSIARSELPHWEEIDKKVHEFVKSLIVEPADVVCFEEKCEPFHKTQEISATRKACVKSAEQKAVDVEAKCAELAMKGDYWGYHQLALLNQKKDNAKAAEYFKKALEVAEQKKTLASKLALGMAYLKAGVYSNYPVEKDLKKGISLLKDVAEDEYDPAGYVPESFYIYTALSELGFTYHEGRYGVAKDQKEAFHWLNEASEKFNDWQAQREMAKMYAKGEGVEQNKEEALKYAILTHHPLHPADKMIEEYSKGFTKQQQEQIRIKANHWYSAYTRRTDPL